TFETLASIKSGASVRAGGDIGVGTDTSVDAIVSADSLAVGLIFWAGADANHDNISEFNNPRGLGIVGRSNVEIGQGVTLTGDTVSLSAAISRLHATSSAGAEALLVFLIGATDAFADAIIGVVTTADVLIDGDPAHPTTITGWEGVDILAKHADLAFVYL